MDEQNEQIAVLPQVGGQERAVTMQHIADRCGVSLITVSRALRSDPRVRPDTTARIREAADMLGYDPACHHAARRLALRKHGIHVINHILALFIQGNFARANYFVNIFRGALEMATEQGFALLTADPAMSEPLPIYTRGDVDGFLVLGWAYQANREMMARCMRSSQGQPCPAVSMLTPVEGFSSVLTDDRAGAYAATAHLLELGHRHIVHFWPVIPEMGPIYLHDERRGGCEQAYRDRGLDPDGWLDALRLDYKQPAERRLHLQLQDALRRDNRITAVLLPNDGFALQAREALRALDQRIPDDISIIGFDDAEVLPDATGHNCLTTVRVPLEEVGRAATELLAKLVTQPGQAPLTLTLPTELTVRATTAPPRR
jgi:DNA-binding LacI/PurR family transcriptional regulator